LCIEGTDINILLHSPLVLAKVIIGIVVWII